MCAGAGLVTVIDPDPRRRDLALQSGADVVLDPATRAAETERSAAEVVIEASGHSSALPSAIKSARRGGRVALLGCTREADVPIDYYKDVHKRGITIIGAHNSARPGHDSSRGYWTREDDYLALARLISAGRLRLAPLIEQIVPATDAPGEYARLLSGQADQAAGAVLFDWR
jgi:threonine dehydrogenase-like Zn-dependent dehydrogenase